MKSILCILLTLILLSSSAAMADEEALQIAPFEAKTDTIPAQAEILHLQVENIARGAYYVSAVTWETGEEAYEWVTGGLSQPMTEEEAQTAVAWFRSGTAFTLTGSSLVDAEKASNKLPCAEGTPLAGNDPVRSGLDWGDSKQCWAGSLSDMLQVTGWGGKATNPDTGAVFANEDELFSYFTKFFTNGGCYQYDGAVWFFSGFYERDVGMADLREEPSGGLIKDQTPPVSRLFGDETGESFAAELEDMFLLLKEGACIGLDVQMAEQMFPLKADPNNFASYDQDSQTYQWSDMHFCEPGEELQKLPFVLDGTGRVVLVTDAGNDQYTDEEGNSYPAAQVMIGQFASYEGHLYATDCEENGPDDRYFTIIRTVTEDELDMEAAIDSYAGSHALTAIGYIRCISGNDPGLRALMIIDSDNDAHYYSPVGENVQKQDRPNVYTLYFTQKDSALDYQTIVLQNYINRRASITGVTLMTLMTE